MAEEVRCRRLPWDSEFFGVPIGTVEADRIPEGDLPRILDWCRERAIECLYFLADPDDAAGLDRVEKRGFERVDERLTLKRDLSSVPLTRPDVPGIRPAAPADLAELRGIARTAHRNTRFYRDGRFSSDRCDALYERWIENSVRGDADCVLVADRGGKAVGYITCHRGAADAARIGLFAVAERARGQGVGANLIRHALGWFVSEGIPAVSVVTQGENRSARRAYEAQGFEVGSVRFWYHYWRVQPRPGTEP